MSRILSVMYHSPCMDGYGAACAVMQNLNADNWQKVHYIPTSYGYLKEIAEQGDVSRIPHMSTHLLFVDMCPEEATIDYLVELGFYLTIIDHHAGAKPTLELEKYNSGNPEVKYMVADKYSGASLLKALGDNINWALSDECVAGESYISNDSPDGPIMSNTDMLVYLNRQLVEDSWLYRLLEIRDIWIKDDLDAKRYSDILASYFKRENTAKSEVVGNLDKIFNDDVINKIITEGDIILSTELAICDDALKHSDLTEVMVGDEKLRIIIGSCPNKLGSNFGEVGNTSVGHNVITVGLFFDFSKSEVGVSLRSKGKFPCLPVAKLLGGGGHPDASGAALSGKMGIDEIRNHIYSAVNSVYKYM